MLMSSFSSNCQDPDEDPTSDLQNNPYWMMNPPPPPPPPPSPSPSPAHGGSGGRLGFASAASSPATDMRQLLITCAELVTTQSDLDAAHRLVSLLSSTSSPYGDSTDRLVHQFARALFLRLNRHYSLRNLMMVRSSSASPSIAASALSTTSAAASASSSTPINMMMIPDCATTTSTTGVGIGGVGGGVIGGSDEYELLQYESSYISLNQVTPFIRFSHLTANQAILDAIEEDGGQQPIHIVDMDTMQGVQWPPLMQAIAARWNPPPMIRITGTGRDLESLRRTGHHLENFAQTLSLRFQFHPLLLSFNHHQSSSSSYVGDLLLHHIRTIETTTESSSRETLAVNCVLYLHKFQSREVHLFLRTIKALNPKVVTLAEREANHSNPNFMQRFVEALDHYTALFDSLEATLPPNSRERLAVEQVWFGREIVDVVVLEGEERKERYQRFQSWMDMMRSSGFSNVPLSPFALSQAKLLLRLHYPSEGYQLHILNNSFFLGWQNHPLFSVSSWH